MEYAYLLLEIRKEMFYLMTLLTFEDGSSLRRLHVYIKTIRHPLTVFKKTHYIVFQYKLQATINMNYAIFTNELV